LQRHAVLASDGRKHVRLGQVPEGQGSRATSGETNDRSGAAVAGPRAIRLAENPGAERGRRKPREAGRLGDRVRRDVPRVPASMGRSSGAHRRIDCY
jgi:hypothetical protein